MLHFVARFFVEDVRTTEIVARLDGDKFTNLMVQIPAREGEERARAAKRIERIAPHV